MLEKGCTGEFLCYVEENGVGAYVWARVDTRRSTRQGLWGEILVTPEQWKIIKPEQPITAMPSAILDWKAQCDGEERIHGYFTRQQ